MAILSILLLLVVGCGSDEPSRALDEVAVLQAELDELRASLATPSTDEPIPQPEELRCEFEDGAALIADATVLVLTDRSHGSAFHLGSGEFVTAAHVVEGYSAVTLVAEGAHVNARVVGLDVGSDIALLSAPDATSLPAIVWLDDAAIRRGMTVGAAGFPVFASGDVAVKRGSISRSFTLTPRLTLIETDTPLSPGNSGGPLFESCGRVVGLVSSKWVDAGVEGIAWAVAASSVEHGLAVARSQPTAPATSSLAGTWVGIYECAQGPTGLQLVLEVEGSTVSGVFEFFALPENPSVAYGRYSMIGSMADGVLVLWGDSWIIQPPAYTVVPLVAVLPEPLGNVLSGIVDDPRCGIFIVERA